MKEFSISVKTVGEEHYIVQAETFEEACEEIKNGNGYLVSSESYWDSGFRIEDEEEI